MSNFNKLSKSKQREVTEFRKTKLAQYIRADFMDVPMKKDEITKYKGILKIQDP